MGLSDLAIVTDVEGFRRAVGRISGEIGGLDIEMLLRPLNHCLSCADLCLANGTSSLDIDDDRKLDVDEIIIGISEVFFAFSPRV